MVNSGDKVKNGQGPDRAKKYETVNMSEFKYNIPSLWTDIFCISHLDYI